MLVKTLAEAPAYEAPNHRNVTSLRLLGFEPGAAEAFWVGLSYVAPGGGAGPDSSPIEKVYLLLDGALTLRSGGEERVLQPMDSCCIPANEVRDYVNHTNTVATLLVMIPYPPKAD